MPVYHKFCHPQTALSTERLPKRQAGSLSKALPIFLQQDSTCNYLNLPIISSPGPNDFTQNIKAWNGSMLFLFHSTVNKFYFHSIPRLDRKQSHGSYSPRDCCVLHWAILRLQLLQASVFDNLCYIP